MLVLVVLAAAAAAGCSTVFGRQYEYEEELYLSVDGSASVIVNTSLAALDALRGLSVGPIGEPPDRERARQIIERVGCPVTAVGRPWTRNGRRFIQVRLATPDVRTLSACPLLSWSTYALAPMEESGLRYQQRVGAPAATGGADTAGWSGQEVVAFRLHLPSRIRYQNVKRLDGSNGDTERGNILTWEQMLTDRRAGKPLDLEVRMDATSILNVAVVLFLGALVAAVLTLLLVVWLVRRRGRQERARAR
jgi:hypothetical protein